MTLIILKTFPRRAVCSPKHRYVKCQPDPQVIRHLRFNPCWISACFLDR